jgi:hypothetical protein
MKRNLCRMNAWFLQLILSRRTIKSFYTVFFMLWFVGCSILQPGRPFPTSQHSTVLSPSASQPARRTPTKPNPSPIPPTETLIVIPTPSPTPYDPRKGLDTGLYVVYWYRHKWYIQGLNGSSAISLIPFESPHSGASLSPDGTRVAFVNSEDQVAVYNFNTGSLSNYPNPEIQDINCCKWSPDGNKLLYVGSPDYIGMVFAHTGIYIISLDNGETKTIIDWNGRFEYGGFFPSWSPDGKWIAFIGRSHGQNYYFEDSTYTVNTVCLSDPTTCIDKSELIKSCKN